MAAGATEALTARGTFSDATSRDLTGEMTWASSDTDVAQISNVDDSHGVATGVRTDMATITVVRGELSAMTTLTMTDAELASTAINLAVPVLNPGEPQISIVQH